MFVCACVCLLFQVMLSAVCCAIFYMYVCDDDARLYKSDVITYKHNKLFERMSSSQTHFDNSTLLQPYFHKTDGGTLCPLSLFSSHSIYLFIYLSICHAFSKFGHKLYAYHHHHRCLL